MTDPLTPLPSSVANQFMSEEKVKLPVVTIHDPGPNTELFGLQVTEDSYLPEGMALIIQDGKVVAGFSGTTDTAVEYEGEAE